MSLLRGCRVSSLGFLTINLQFWCYDLAQSRSFTTTSTQSPSLRLSVLSKTEATHALFIELQSGISNSRRQRQRRRRRSKYSRELIILIHFNRRCCIALDGNSTQTAQCLFQSRGDHKFDFELMKMQRELYERILAYL